MNKKEKAELLDQLAQLNQALDKRSIEKAGRLLDSIMILSLRNNFPVHLQLQYDSILKRTKALWTGKTQTCSLYTPKLVNGFDKGNKKNPAL